MKATQILWTLAFLLSVDGVGLAQKRALDHDDYALWSTLQDPVISSHGAWALYSLRPGDDGDGRLLVHSTLGDQQHEVERCASGQFDWQENWVACRQEPARAEAHAAELEGKKDDDRPKPGLALLDLESGEVELIERVKSFALPKKAGGVIAWLHEKGGAEREGDEESEKEGEELAEEVLPGEPGAEGEPEPEETPEKEKAPEVEKTPEEKAQERKDEKKKENKKDGTVLVLRDLASGSERRFEHVIEYEFSDDGRWLAFLTNEKEESTASEEISELSEASRTAESAETPPSPDGAYVVAVGQSGDAIALLTGTGEYAQLAFDEASQRLAFLSNSADWQNDAPAWSLYHWAASGPAASAAMSSAEVVARAGSTGLPTEWAPSQHREPVFSRSGRRLYFGSAPRPVPEPPEIPKDDQVVLDVWSWTDDLIQPQQLSQLDEEKKRSYLAVADLEDPRETPPLVQLGSLEVPEVRLSEEADSRLALGVSSLPYRKMTSWDNQVYRDVFAIDVETGERRLVIEKRRGNYRLSPGGRYAYWWDAEQLAWYALDLEDALDGAGTREAIDLSTAIGHRVDNELHDSPSLPGSYGAAGWLEGDAGLLLYDRYDVWLVDPRNPRSPRSITEGAGRRDGVRYRVVDLDPEEDALDPGASLLLASFDDDTKDAGFHRDTISGSTEPEELITAAASFSRPIPAVEGDDLLFRRGRFDQFEDLWISDRDLSNPVQLSDANPQQAEYSWGTAELVHWTSLDGEELDGVLYKPEGFDPSKKYPLITYFYERTSDNLHNYTTPIPHRSIIRFSFYTSRGYLVFAPDIPYQIGHPGPSAYNAIVPGVLKLVEQGFVEEEAIGVQGHSWGGYQTAYLITQTDLFSAAVAGAVVSNMTSAYGGVRWQSGMSRMFQYEKTQSRIGGTLWQELHRYLDNSPLFYADRVDTPLLMMHNDQDGAVPWYQGIELFLALRRLDKPVWMLNYNGQPHWVITKANQIDYATRMQQFFDHYLRGAPAASWMVDGVRAIDKGRSLGLELIEPVGEGSAGQTSSASGSP